MMKLRRTYEAAAEEGKPIEEIALERFGTLEAFEEAKEERRILDEHTEILHSIAICSADFISSDGWLGVI